MATNVQTGTLSLDDIALAPIYQTFRGRYVDAMPALRADNRTAMFIPDLMKRRLQVLKSGNKNLINAWWNHYFNSSTGIAYRGDEVKVVQNAQLLQEVTQDTKFSEGALVLKDAQYKEQIGPTFSRKELKKAGVNDWLTKSQVLKHPVWQAVAGSELLEQYADAHFKRYDAKNAMGVYLSSPQDKPTMRALVLNDGDVNGSYLCGYGDLDYGDARLVGVCQDLETKATA